MLFLVHMLVSLPAPWNTRARGKVGLGSTRKRVLHDTTHNYSAGMQEYPVTIPHVSGKMKVFMALALFFLVMFYFPNGKIHESTRKGNRLSEYVFIFWEPRISKSKLRRWVYYSTTYHSILLYLVNI